MEISKSKISLFSSLSTKKMRQKHRLFIVEGEKSVVDSIGSFDVVWICATTEWIGKHDKLIIQFEDKIYEVSESEMRKISSLHTAPEVLAILRLPEQNTEIEINQNELYLMLDGIQDPGNMGTIIRTADWFGINTIIASPTCVDIYNTKCIQSTMGSLARVNVVYKCLSEVIDSQPDMPVYGTLLTGKNIYHTKLGNNGFIIFGNEGNGISEELRGKITTPLLIPPYNPHSHAESLNVASAVAVTLSIFRNR